MLSQPYDGPSPRCGERVMSSVSPLVSLQDGKSRLETPEFDELG